MKRFIISMMFLVGLIEANAQGGYFRPEYMGHPTDSNAWQSLKWNPDLGYAVWDSGEGSSDNDSVFTMPPDTICVIFMGDTVCVSNDSTLVNLTGDSLCVISGGDTICVELGQFSDTNLANTDLTQDMPRAYNLQSYSLSFQENGSNRFRLNPNAPSPGDLASFTEGYTLANQSLLALTNNASSTNSDAMLRFQCTLTPARHYALGVDRSLSCFAFCENNDLGSDVWLRYYGDGDSIVTYKSLKIFGNLLDRDGDAGSNGNILARKASGNGVDWVTAASLGDGNGFFTSSNSGGTIATNFDAIVTDSLQLRGNNGINKNIYFSLHAPAANGNANLFLTNSTSGSDQNDGLLIQFSGSEQANIMNRTPNGGMVLGVDNDEKFGMYSSQSGVIYEPSVNSWATFVASKGIHDNAKDDISVQDTLSKINSNVNITAGAAGDTIFLPELTTGPTLESCSITQTMVGQQYTISNFRGGGTAVVISVMNVSGTDDIINGGSSVTIADGKSAIIKAVAIPSGVGRWFSWTSD